jgi:hypothetical protein
LSDEAGRDARKGQGGPAREEQASLDEAHEQTGEGASEDMPTLPPASRGSVVGLRWATLPLQRRAGHVAPDRPAPDRSGPDRSGPERYGTGPPTVVLPTVAMPTVPSGPHLRPDAGSSVLDDTAVDLGGPEWIEGIEGVEGPDELDAHARRARRRGRTVLLLAVLALVIALAVGALALGGTSPRRTAGRTSTPEATFEGLLVKSAQAHRLLAAAVSGACQPAPPATAARQGLIAELGRAVEMRRSVLDGIATDRPGLLAMNGGPPLVSDLDDATSASLSADQGYEAWLEDLQATGCYGAPTNDIHYRDATQASAAASVAKEGVVRIWAGVASRYGLPSWTAGQL